MKLDKSFLGLVVLPLFLLSGLGGLGGCSRSQSGTAASPSSSSKGALSAQPLTAASQIQAIGPSLPAEQALTAEDTALLKDEEVVAGGEDEADLAALAPAGQ